MLEYVIIEARRQPQNEVVLTKRIARNQRISVGRTDSADLVMNDDPEISSIHFLIAVSDELCTVTDQGSTNKTWYNGKPIAEINIGDGERILCGKTEFTFRLFAEFENQTSPDLFSKDQPWVDPGSETSPSRDAATEAKPRADRPTGDKPVPVPPSIQSPQRKPKPPAAAPLPTSKPTPPDNPDLIDSASASSTESEDIIDWSLFGEQEPMAGNATDAEVPEKNIPRQSEIKPQPHSHPIGEGWDTSENASDAEKTQVLDSLTRSGTIARVVIKIAGQSDDTMRQVIDPNQRPKAVIGRAASSHLVCPADPFMSNRHFAIEIQGNRCTIQDLETSNGTWLNGQQILIAPLRHGDRIRAGQTDFEIAFESGP